MSDEKTNVTDLAAAGLLGALDAPSPESEEEQQTRLLRGFDEFMSSILMKITQVENRVERLERFISYLLVKDPVVKARVEAEMKRFEEQEAEAKNGCRPVGVQTDVQGQTK